MRGSYLSSLILQNIRICPLQHSGCATTKTCGVLSQFPTTATSFDPDELHVALGDKLLENSNCVGSSANTRNDGRRKAVLGSQNLDTCLLADYGLKIADHGWVGMCAEHTAEQIMCRTDVGNPVAHGFIDGVLQRARARLYAVSLRATQS